MMHDDPPDHLSEPSTLGAVWWGASQEGLIEDAGTGTANGFAALPEASQVDWRAGRDVERVLARPAKLISLGQCLFICREHTILLFFTCT